MLTCVSGNMAGLCGASVLARVIFVDTPTMGGTEISTMPIVVNNVLYLADATFGISEKKRGGGVSGGGSGI